jgi:ABC-type amino acid transport substrate-binding protein
LNAFFEKEPALIKRFDKGLKKLKKKGVYEKLLRKWGLAPDGESLKEIEQKATAFTRSFY